MAGDWDGHNAAMRFMDEARAIRATMEFPPYDGTAENFGLDAELESLGYETAREGLAWLCGSQGATRPDDAITLAVVMEWSDRMDRFQSERAGV